VTATRTPQPAANRPPTPRSPSTPAAWLACAGCGASAAPFTLRCPNARPGEDVDHVIARHIDPAAMDPTPAPDANPFVRYRTRFHAWHLARAAGWPDERYVELVRALDERVAVVDGHGFRVTPLVRSQRLDDRLGFAEPGGAWLKDETGNVSGSHKARHLMGVMLELLVAEAVAGADPARPLAIASCGNAALAAAVVARAAERTLQVFVPPHAEEPVLRRLAGLGAVVTVCPRVADQPGDPSYHALQAAISAGAVPFTCQGNENGLVIEGGATLGWEIVDQLAETGTSLDRFVVQVGGGALASALALAFEEAGRLGLLARRPRLDIVQAEGAWPLVRAWHGVVEQLGVTPGVPVDVEAHAAALADVARHRSRFMWAWESEPHSVAGGILDDETYDWLAVVRAMLATGGRAIVADEATLREANETVHETAGIPADHTGSAGLAGLIQSRRDGSGDRREVVGLVMSGVVRTAPKERSRP
jgi:threonine synthase